jgi:hypothetical protein
MLDNPVSTLALLRFAGALELNQMRPTGLPLTELQPAVRDREVGISPRSSAPSARHTSSDADGPLGEDPAIETEDHPHERLDPAYNPRGCAYEHIHVLMEHLRRLGHTPTIDVPNNAFSELEHVER